MLIFKDETKLSREFPFRLAQYTLRKEDNTNDSYHYHDFCEITYVRRGKGRYLVNGRCYDVTPGDLIIFNNVEPHGWQVLDREMDVMVIMFAPELVSDPGNVFSGEYLRPFIERGSNFQNQIRTSDRSANVIYEIMLEIQREVADAQKGYKNMIKADILRILTYLARHYQMEDDSLIEQKRHLKRLEPALLYINEHYTEVIKLEEAASCAFMSPNYFSAYFKKAIGRTFSEYVTLLRLKKVKEMYQMTDCSMAELALDCGFQNISNFYRMYKKYMGELPDRNGRRRECK